MLASSSHASVLAMVFSKSFERRRQRLSQAGVRSMTQRLGWTLNVPAFSDRGDDLNGPLAELGERAGQLFPAVGAISENVTQLRKQQSNMLEQRRCSVAILDIGGVYLP